MNENESIEFKENYNVSIQNNSKGDMDIIIKYIEKENRRIVYICSSLFLDKSVREATINERLSYRHENTKHGDKPIVGRRQDTSDEKT